MNETGWIIIIASVCAIALVLAGVGIGEWRAGRKAIIYAGGQQGPVGPQGAMGPAGPQGKPGECLCSEATLIALSETVELVHRANKELSQK